MTSKGFARLGACLIGSAAIITSAVPSDAQSAWNPVVIRGAGEPASGELRLAYQATFPDGRLDSSVDHLNVGAMQEGPTLIPNTNPIFAPLPGEMLIGITRPVDLDPDAIPSASLFATPVDFGPGSVFKIRATFIAPVGPLPGGGFAIGIGGKTGGKDDLPDDTRVFTTVNVRPGYLVRLNVPFGSVETRNMVLPQAVKDAIFSTTDPQPFTLTLTVDRIKGTGKSELKVGDQVFTLTFTLEDFRADGGPAITAVGPGIAVNANGPGKTATVHVRDFRIYTNSQSAN